MLEVLERVRQHSKLLSLLKMKVPKQLNEEIEKQFEANSQVFRRFLFDKLVG